MGVSIAQTSLDAMKRSIFGIGLDGMRLETQYGRILILVPDCILSC
jgi:hypothetical protein